jgi:RimJ/RimL family protein N-acetyltransferase
MFKLDMSSRLSMNIRRLTPSDASAFQSLRLAGLNEAPTAFGSSYAEEKDQPTSAVATRLENRVDQAVFGAFSGQDLVGVVALGKERMNNLAHKGFIWGMYVKPQFRGSGVARALLEQALAFAATVPGMRQVNLSVNSSNAAAARLYESVGFRAFGHERGAMLINGELHDETHMSLQLNAG